MAIRFYILPIEVVQLNETDNARGPKYFPWRFDPDPPALVTAQWSMMDYGAMNTALVAADVTPEQHDLLAAQTDVIVAPENIDTQIGGTINVVRSRLESLKIPGNTVQAADTFRNALRVVAGVFQFAQKFEGQYGRSVFDEVTGLNTTWGELSPEFQNELLVTAQLMNIDTSGVTANTTMRQIMRRMADAWEDRTFFIGGFEL